MASCDRRNYTHHEDFQDANRRVTIAAEVDGPTTINGISFTSSETTVDLCPTCYHWDVKRDPSLKVTNVDPID